MFLMALTLAFRVNIPFLFNDLIYFISERFLPKKRDIWSLVVRQWEVTKNHEIGGRTVRVGRSGDIFWYHPQHSITFIRWSTLASNCVLIDSRQYNLSPGWAIKRCANSLWNISTAHLHVQTNQIKHDCYNTGKSEHFSQSLFLSFDCLVFINTLNTLDFEVNNHNFFIDIASWLLIEGFGGKRVVTKFG